MLSLELTNEELFELGYNKEAIRRILVSRAIYNESLDHLLSEEDLRDLEFMRKNEIREMYIIKEIEPKIHISETLISEEYSKNKDFFDSNNISFKDARGIILENLRNLEASKLAQLLIEDLIKNMQDKVELSKDDVLATKGESELIKIALINNIVIEKLNNTNFMEENKELLDTKIKEARINLFVNKMANKEPIDVTEDEISKVYVENKEKFENTSLEEARDIITKSIIQSKIDANVNLYISTISKKYNIEELVEKYTKNGDIIN